MKQMEIALDLIEQVVIGASSQAPRYIVVSRNKKYIQISAMAHTILEKVRAGHSFPSIAQTMTNEEGINVTSDEVERAYQYVIDKIHKIDGEQNKQLKNFWLRIPFVPPEMVAAISSYLTFLFHPVAVFIFFSSLATLSIYAFERGLLTRVESQNVLIVPLFYLLFMISLLAHELGHASACLHGGAKPGEIGFTIYMVFPAFYSDVSVSWQLSRWQRVRVDIGGIYFQLYVGIIYLVLYLLSRQQVFLIAFLGILSSCAISLNPFGRFDGYWILSDALGVTNLARQPNELMAHYYHILRKKPHKSLPYHLGVNIIIAIYGLVRIGLLTSFIVFMPPLLWNRVLSYPILLRSSIYLLQHGSLFSLFAVLQTLGTNSLYFVLWGMALFFLGRSFFAKIPLARNLQSVASRRL